MACYADSVPAFGEGTRGLGALSGKLVCAGCERGLGKLWTKPPAQGSLGVLLQTFPPFCTHYVLLGLFGDGFWTRSFGLGCGCHWPGEGLSHLLAHVYWQTRCQWGSG